MPRRHSRRRHRHRHRSSFSSSRGGAPWLQPVQRRHRRRLPLGPVVAAVIVLAAAAGAFAFVRSREDAADDPSRAAVQKFADAWAKGDLDAAWKLTTAATQQQQPLRLFRQSYTQSARAATVTRVKVGVAGEPRAGKVAVPVVLTTKLFGRRRGTITFPVKRTGDTARIAWTPDLRLPGLRPGEAVKRRLLRRPTRANVLDAFGRRLAREPSAAALVGTAPARRPAGHRPGGALRRAPGREAGRRAALRQARSSRKVPVVRGKSVRTTVRPSVQATATGALGGRLGGVAVVNPRTGAVLALTGLAVSGPQPPGSVFKIITLATALEHGVAEAVGLLPGPTAATLSGVKLRNASDEQCGGSLTLSFAHSCNSVFGPLGAQAGRASGSSPPPRRSASTRSCRSRASSRARSRRARAERRSRGRRERDRPGPRPRDAAHDGIGRRDDRQRRRAREAAARAQRAGRPRRVVRRSVAAQVRDMMLAVVRGGPAPRRRCPGSSGREDGHGRAAPTAGAAPDPSNTDAWFVAFAPASSPRVAVGVMLVGAGAGGAAAAPVAREVLAPRWADRSRESVAAARRHDGGDHLHL